MSPRSVSGFVLFVLLACVLLPNVVAEDDVDEEVVTTSSCGGGGYGYTESVELENIEVLCDVMHPAWHCAQQDFADEWNDCGRVPFIGAKNETDCTAHLTGFLLDRFLKMASFLMEQQSLCTQV
jgi:hypothetical protein